MAAAQKVVAPGQSLKGWFPAAQDHLSQPWCHSLSVGLLCCPDLFLGLLHVFALSLEILVILLLTSTGAEDHLSENQARRIVEGIAISVRFNWDEMMDGVAELAALY